MRQNVWHICGLITALVAVCSGVARAQTVAVGPYYATPSWDQTVACTTAASCPRFVVLSNFANAAVLDRETGLVWEQSPSAAANDFRFAIYHCAFATIGGRGGWRMPTFHEMQSLLDNQALPAGHPFANIQVSVAPTFRFYWTATNDPGTPDGSTVFGVAFDTNFGAAPVTSASKSSASGFPAATWCVRGGAGVNSNQF